MCGGMKVSRTVANKKEDQIAREAKRLAKLEQGKVYIWPFVSGERKVVWDGHARSENLDTTWHGKIKEHVKIKADEFYERDSVSGSYKFKSFKVPEGKCIYGVITNQDVLRIVTQPANEEVKKVHRRMPRLVDIDKPIDVPKSKVQIIKL